MAALEPVGEDGGGEVGRLFDWEGHRFARRAGNGGIAPATLDRAGYFIDLDDDGAPDFLSVQAEGTQAFRNDGAGRFEEAPDLIGGIRQDRHVYSMAASDLDSDGDGDLFFAHWSRPWNGVRPPAGYLWRNDGILDAGERADVREHFLGPVMYLAAVDPLNAHWSPYLVYDGQQRLTTVSLILEALARHLRDDTAPDGFEPAQIRNDYLLNAYPQGSPGSHRILAASLQHHPPTRQPGIPAAGPGNDRHAKLGAWLRYAPLVAQLGGETVNALKFNPDRSTGAGQSIAPVNLRAAGESRWSCKTIAGGNLT